MEMKVVVVVVVVAVTRIQCNNSARENANNL